MHIPKVLFEPSECVCQVRDLIVNAISPLLLLLGLLLCPWMWGIFFWVVSNIILSTVVQQQVVILEFLQEKMSAHPFAPPS